MVADSDSREGQLRRSLFKRIIFFLLTDAWLTTVMSVLTSYIDRIMKKRLTTVLRNINIERKF